MSETEEYVRPKLEDYKEFKDADGKIDEVKKIRFEKKKIYEFFKVKKI